MVRCLAKHHDPFLVALAPHLDPARVLLQVDVAQRQRAQLRVANPCVQKSRRIA